MAQDYLRELLVCETCGQSYTSNYKTCPHCKAEARAKEISRGKKKKRPSPLVLGVSAALIVGAGCIFFGALASDGLSIGRERAVEEEETTIQIISSSVTQQKSQIDAFIEETDAPEEDDSAAE